MGKKVSDEKPTPVVLIDVDNSEVNKLLNIYNIDKSKAKIYFEIRKNEISSFVKYRTVSFEYSNGDYRVARLARRFGVSKTNKIYSRESNEYVVIYKKKENKFYFSRNRQIKQLTYSDLCCLFSNFSDTCPVYQYFLNKIGWLRNVKEMGGLANSISFNRIISKKLFNQKKIFSEIYQVPYPVAKIISNNSGFNYLNSWLSIKDHLINVENLTTSFLKMRI